ncbi:MAG: 50S ribosomal protein L7/L12 [Pseudomonadota bacterium]|nr:50S ribosomal protein L7/L12 [Pseudomonadota bacterium]
MTTPVQLPPDAIQALEQGQTIRAIKAVRQHRQLGLKESKALVEQYLQQNPERFAHFRAAQTQNAASSQRVIWLLSIIFLVGLMWWQGWFSG